MLDHLGTHYAEASVRRLARVVGGSPDHLATCFREQTRYPLKAYMTGLSRSLLKLAERDGRASYPQFTARRGMPT